MSVRIFSVGDGDEEWFGRKEIFAFIQFGVLSKKSSSFFERFSFRSPGLSCRNLSKIAAKELWQR